MADNVTNHTHAQYAHKGHTHDEYYANVNHEHNYASESHSHTLPEIEGGDALIKSMWSNNNYVELEVLSSDLSRVEFTGEGPRLSEENGVVLVSIKYLSNNGLVDQSLYAVKFEKTPPIGGGTLYYTYNLVKILHDGCSDSLAVKYIDESTVEYAVTLNKGVGNISISGAQIHVI